MFKNGIKILFAEVLLSVGLTGCASVPESNTTDAGVEQAVGREEKEREEILGEESGYLTKTENGYTCDVSLGSSGEKLRIKTDFPDIDYNSVDILDVVPSAVEFDRESIVEHFFDGDGQLQEIDDIEPYDKEKAYDGEEEGMLKKTSVNHAFHVANVDNTVTFSRFSDSSFFYRNDIVDSKYMELSVEDYVFSSAENVNGEYTIDMAWEELKEHFAALGLDDLELEYYQGFSRDGETYYGIYYMVKVEGLPLANGLSHGDINEINVYGFAEVGNSGIGMIQLDNMLWDVVESKETKVITPEQLMGVLEKHVNNGDITCSSSVIFERAKLMYMLTTDDWETFALKPVWRIYIPLEQYLLNTDTMGDITTDIVIDGETGDLISIN
ncbi:MAG: hypothetical protein ACI4A3_09160 [Lachnospiraceae bacterium]